MDSEKRWIKKIKKNSDDASANELVSKYYKELYAFAYKQTLDADLSLDLTQEIFISALQSINSFDSSKASFRTWLYKIGSNRIVDYYRSRSYKYTQLIQPLEEYEMVDSYDMAVSLEYKDDFEKVITLVNGLDSRSQQIMRLKLFGEYTLQEIASIEDIPLSTVKTRYYTTLKVIRKGMEENHGQREIEHTDAK